MPDFDSESTNGGTVRATTGDISLPVAKRDPANPAHLQARLEAVLEDRDRLSAEVSNWRHRAIRAEIETARAQAEAEALRAREHALKEQVQTLLQSVSRIEGGLAKAEATPSTATGGMMAASPAQDTAPTSTAPVGAAPVAPVVADPSDKAPDQSEPAIPERLAPPGILPLEAAGRRVPTAVFNAVAILGADDASLFSGAARLTRPGPESLIATLQSGQYDVFMVSAVGPANEASWRATLTDPAVLERIRDGAETARRLGKKTVLLDCERLAPNALSSLPLDLFDMLVTRDLRQADDLDARLGTGRVVLRPDALLDPTQHSPFVPRSAASRDGVLAPVSNDRDADWLSGASMSDRVVLVDNRTAWPRPYALRNAVLKRGDLVPVLPSHARATKLTLAGPNVDCQTRAIVNACGAPCVGSASDATALLNDESALQTHRHLAWRETSQKTQTVFDFMETIAVGLGLLEAPSGPGKLVVVARLDDDRDLNLLKQSLARQLRSPETLILMSHTLGSAQLGEAAAALPLEDIRTCTADWLELATLCNQASDDRSAVAVMRNKAFYGRHYLDDLGLAARSVDDCVLGRHSRYIQADRSRVELVDNGRCLRQVTGIYSASAAFTGNAINGRNLERALSWDWFTTRGPVVSLDTNGFVEISDPTNCDPDAVRSILEA
jgi:hypothetical protein